MKNMYEELPKLKVELSFVKVLMIVITVLVSLVLPAQAITYFRDYKPKQDAIAAQQAQKQNGKVAGISTTKTEQISNSIDLTLLGKDVELSRESGVLITSGLAITAAALVILVVLIMNDKIKYL